MKKQKENADRIYHELKVAGATIYLNTCTEDQLRRLTKLTEHAREQIILERTKLKDGFTEWQELDKVLGVGSAMLKELMTYCHDASIGHSQARSSESIPVPDAQRDSS